MDNQVCMGLRALKLSGMADEFARQQTTPASADASVNLRILQMIAAEEDMRADRRRKRLLTESGLNPAIAPESIDFDPRRGLDRAMIEDLLSCRWIRLGNNATIVGMTGSGKSYLATSLGRAAIRQGLSVRSVQAHLLAEDMAIARIDGSLRKLRQIYKKCDLLIIDEFALHDIDDQAKQDLLDIFEARADAKSTIVVGQRAIAEWHAFIEMPLIADALLDRILCRSYNITLDGDTMRRRAPKVEID